MMRNGQTASGNVVPGEPSLDFLDTPGAGQALAERARAQRWIRFRFILTVVTLTTIGYGLLLAFLGQSLYLGIGDVLLGMTFFALRQWALRAPDARRTDAVINACALLGTAAIVWNALFTGGVASLSWWFLPCIPVLVALIVGAREAIVWAGVGGTVLVATWAVGNFMLPPLAAADFPPGMLVGSQLLLMFVLTTYAISSRRMNDQQMAALQKAYETVVAQKELLAQQTRTLNDSLCAAENARRLADEASRAKSDFLAVMSHEIRTPLNGVIGLNSLLLDMPLPDDVRRYAELSRQSGETLLVLINDFLDFTKIEGGHLKLEAIDFEPGTVIEEALAVVREGAERKGIALRSEVGVPARLHGDPARLRQILLNLLSNAVKFTARGEVLLRAEVVSRGSESTILRFTVRDTGIGIEPETLGRLFRPFSQADASTTRRYGGTGLGLAICKALTDLMGGHIRLSSVPGQGSEFVVELPFRSRLDAVAAPAIATAATGDGRAAASGGASVLLAEDNPVNRFVTTEMLVRLGCEVDVIENGAHAIDAVRRKTYDLVLMDCEMPITDGFEATRAIREMEGSLRYTPIVAMTAGALSGDRERCLAAGMDDYLAKPARLEDVEKILATWLAR